MSTARLSTYIEKAHHETGSFRRERIFDYGLAHTAPYLERDRVNRILVYPGSFNPPHNGHNTSLSHAFNNSGCDLNLIAAIIIPLDDIIITGKVGNHKGAIVLTKEQRVALWRGESGLEPGPSFWVFDRSTNEWKSFQRRLAQAVSADGFEIDFVVLCGPDHVAVNKQPPIPSWGCKHVIMSDVGRPADFASRASKHLTQLEGCERWERVLPDLDHLQRRAEEGASSMRGAKSAESILESDPESIERTTKELLDTYLAEYKYINICRSESDHEATIRFIATKSTIPEISSTDTRKIIAEKSGDELLEELKNLVPDPDLLLRFIAKNNH